MEVYRRSSGLLLLLGLSLLATTLQGVQGEVELEGPSESECRPYIEKALKELETGEVAEGSLADQGDSKEDIPTVEITDDSDHHDGDGEIDDANEDGQENKENEIISEKKLEPEVRHSFLQKLSSFFQKIFHKTPSKKEEAANERKRSEDKQDDASVERGDQPSVDNEESKEENEGDSKEGESKEDESKEIDSTGAEVKDDDSKEGDDNDEIEVDKDDDKEKQADRVDQLKEETDDEQKDDDDDSKEENEKVAESDEQTDDQQKDDEDDNKSELEKESVEEVFEAVEAQRLMQGQDDQEGDSKEEDQDDAEEIPQADEAKSEEDVQEDDSKEDLKGVPQEDTKDDSKEENREEIKDDTQEDSNEETKDDSERETKDSKEGVQDDSKIDDEESGKDDSEEHDKDDSKEKETTTKEETADSKEDVTESKEIQGADKSEENAGMQDSQEDDKNEKEDDDKKDEDSAEDVLASKEDDKDDNKEESVEDKDDKSDEKTVAKKEKDDEDSTENDETRQSYEDGGPVEELSLDTEIPTDLRPRDHVEQLLKLDDESSESENLINKVSEITLRDLKKLYENAIKPLEVVYKYRDLSNRHFGDSEIFSKPLILFMGPWSGGKSSIINYLTNNEYNETSLRTGAEPSPAYFNILTYGEEPEVIDGTELAVDFTFSGLQKFGQGLEERLRGLKLPSKLLEKVNIVEIPGILEVRKQVSRVFPFNDACQWFIDRGDIIFLVYDPSKLDVGPETEAILDQLKGREHQTRIILNKADQVKPEELMRVQGALIWNISPLMSSPQPPIMYTTSLWSRPYESWAPVRLLQAQERAFLRDLRGAIDKRIENKIASARRFAVRVRNHAKMVDCYLTTYYNHKSVFGNRKQVADAIIEHPQDYHIYEGLSTLTNISRYDLPDPDVYRDFFKLNPLYEFQQLSATCTYFRGCPINRLDIAIAYDLPELLGTHKKRVESALIEAAAPQADAGQQKSAPGS